ncbi:hypothetical protein [Moorena sp. SIO1G6]|nr:hypothetical protein [Moorena sp. SIO1G6]
MCYAHAIAFSLCATHTRSRSAYVLRTRDRVQLSAFIYQLSAKG